MKTLYIECNMGAAGDMLMAALSELIDDPQGFVDRMNALGLPGVRLERRRAEKCGITGSHIAVTVDGEEEHSRDVHNHGEQGTGNREQGTGNREQGTGNREQGTGNREQGTGNREQRTGNREQGTGSREQGTGNREQGTGAPERSEWLSLQAQRSKTQAKPALAEGSSAGRTGNREQEWLGSHDHPHDHDHPHGHAHPHDHAHSHRHASLADIRQLIGALALPDRVKADAMAVYARIAEAEARVHGHPVEQVHFHEVGALDAVADVVGVCALMHEIAPQRVVVSPVHVGSGQVRCAHGVLPVPAPATALLLEGAPIYGGAIRGELCTPTGAALLAHFADGFGDMPAMTLQKTGCGMGMKDFEWANCLRAMLGEVRQAPEDVVQLSCNLDDMTGEAIAFAAERLRDAGALDVWTQAIQMKKGRPGTLLSCLCSPSREEAFAELMLRHTTTLGVRCQTLRRHTLQREETTLDTQYGPVRVKRSYGHGVQRSKPEFDDLSEIARREGISVGDIIL